MRDLIRTPEGSRTLLGIHFQSKVLLTIPLVGAISTAAFFTDRLGLPYPTTWTGLAWAFWPAYLVVGYMLATVYAISQGRRVTPIRLFFEFVVVMYTLVVSFASIYYRWSEHPGCLSQTGHLSRTAAVYFSTVTTATVGYGDIYPKSAPCQAVVTGQILTDLFVFGFYAAVLVSIAAGALASGYRARAGG